MSINYWQSMNIQNNIVRMDTSFDKAHCFHIFSAVIYL